MIEIIVIATIIIIYIGLSIAGKLLSGTANMIAKFIKGLVKYLTFLILFVYTYTVLAMFAIIPRSIAALGIALLIYLTQDGVAYGLSGMIALTMIRMIPVIQQQHFFVRLLIAIVLMWLFRAIIGHITEIADEDYFLMSFFVENKFFRVVSVFISIALFGTGIVLLA